MDKSEILKSVEDAIRGYQSDLQAVEVGTVVSVGDGVAEVTGLSRVMSSEMVVFENGVAGMALNLLDGIVGVIIFGDAEGIKEGMRVERTKNVLQVPVGDLFLGRVVNALGVPIDGGGDIKEEGFYPIEKVAPGVITRKSVSVPLQTGIKAIDAMIPIGRGQRELIIGDRQTGKTSIAIDTILNQKDQNVFCIYVAIGQKDSKIAQIASRLKNAGAMSYTVIISAGASESAAMSFIAPYAGCALGEYFMDNGKDALIVYDDLSKHAVAYRQISLILKRPPGREAYPGDVFYLHSRLLERAARLNEDNGGGSLTALPIIETQGGDVSAYIPTNVISITDGQIYLETDLFNKGVRPAVNVGLSVSRVGGAAQIKAMKKIAGKLRIGLAQFRELEAFAQFGADLDNETKEQLEAGFRLVELLKQGRLSPMPVAMEVIAIYLGVNGMLREIKVINVAETAMRFLSFIEGSYSGLIKRLEADGSFDDEWEDNVRKAFVEFKDTLPTDWLMK